MHNPTLFFTLLLLYHAWMYVTGAIYNASLWCYVWYKLKQEEGMELLQELQEEARNEKIRKSLIKKLNK